MGMPMTSVNGVFVEELGRLTNKMQKTLESKVILFRILGNRWGSIEIEREAAASFTP
jgi:hypothetical protein